MLNTTCSETEILIGRNNSTCVNDKRGNTNNQRYCIVVNAVAAFIHG